MKKLFLLLTLSLIIFSCNNTEEKSDKTDIEKYGPAKMVNPNMAAAGATMPIIRGEFVYVGDAAVLKGSDYIYGVVLDTLAMELAERVRPVKRDEFDMVKVAVKGVVTKKEAGSEGWDEKITIKEIVYVASEPSEADVKIQEKK